ncbi:MAG: hypothetical protein WEE50_03905 [Chloroflexota bacterium]
MRQDSESRSDLTRRSLIERVLRGGLSLTGWRYLAGTLGAVPAGPPVPDDRAPTAGSTSLLAERHTFQGGG